MRLIALLAAILLLGACQKKNSNEELRLTPGRAGTFLAVGTELSAVFEQPATEKEPAVKYRVRVSPNRGISIGTAVGGEGQGDLSEAQTFTPASITKVITTSAALKHLGPEFRFHTRVSWRRVDESTIGDLTIKADGDPFVTKNKLKDVALELKKRGVKRLVGKLNLVSADRRKDQFIPAFGLDPEDYFNCYGARVQSFNLNRNCSTLLIAAWNQARWTDTSVIASLRFDLIRPETPRLSVTHDYESDSVKGFVIKSVGPQQAYLALPVPDVKSWYGNSLAVELRKAGIDVSAASSARDEDLPGDESYEIESVTLAELARLTNKVSDNYLAEAMYKAAAGFSPEPNINDAAIAVTGADIKEWLKVTHSESLAEELRLYDGAGLARANKVTPRAFLSLLKAFTYEKWFPALWDSLPIAGVDGTLRGRMGGTAASRLVRAKTGTLRGAYQLAGYIPKLGPGGEVIDYIPFVLLTATTPTNQGGARAFQDKLLAELVQQVNKKR